ncbi:flagellar hook-length control protein FliK [Zoogloea dura]|uniref:Flagellar hook-length control protein FliK n=1 Tax=Zoogloea dura TaxID=2728840 RepID=A0A848G1I4_9RHOO|nr:flagellar hook-length control protein FliK [Zoogloea dura]NML24999.1 flagellar hook-length control protein FliK [Zoogloea dura]
MIPSDLASRLRMLTEASFFSGEPTVAPLNRVRAISSRLPDFTPGERITATLHQANQDNTYQGRVNGREVVLSLPPSVKSGDTLELVVSHVTPQAVFASLAQPQPTAGDKPALSQTGKLISFLLTGQPPAGTARLSGGQPLITAAPGNQEAINQLASRLGSAVSGSGLFYESHQARWLAGQIDTASLLREPQGKEAPHGTRGTESGRSSPLPSLAAAITGGDAAEASSAGSGATGVLLKAEAQPVAERLVPLVHQQLDALATHQVAWQGQAWPGQMMEWEIEDPEGREGGEDGEPDPYWNTTLRLTMPGLGGIEARLHLTPAGVAVRLIASEADSRDRLEAGQQRLADALAAANVPLTGLVAELKVPDEQP